MCYFNTDQIGTPLEMTNAEGQIVWQAKYRAWSAIDGLVVNEVEQNLRFQGQYFDDETGLHYNTFRYYDPEVGRFTTQDPIGLLGGENLYQYAPSPVGWVDPLGWCSDKLGRNMGAKTGDGMANHHLIPEELMKSKIFSAMFRRLKNVGFDGDGASNGIFLPGKEAVKNKDLPGHWTSHKVYTTAVGKKLMALNKVAPGLTDTQLVLGVKEIQDWARVGLKNGAFEVEKLSGRLL